ncbi:Selenide, water dikinase [Oligella urethralis]|uniref:Selenide, water dikinase n=1 Tax=Oligella urethralis TaxID=90245 RepID=A0A2X1UN43_9BURK|nr:selenide, water dikinase SelD [Oligella urethralis]WOS37543.1 Selenide, water dikinase [Oligella urethralis]SPY08592.1 Selenide, water dikinase [Oligella urethralis]
MAESNTTQSNQSPRLTSLSHGGGCGCKIAPDVLSNLMASMPTGQAFPNLLVGNETVDDAAVFRLNDEQALIATTDFFMPIVDDPYDFGRIAATNALSDIYAMGGTPVMALALVAMPINVLPHDQIAKILQGGADVCQQAGIPVAGGHSIDSVEPIYGLAAMGTVHPEQVKRNSKAKTGDVLILTKGLGIGVFSAALKKNALPETAYQLMIASTTQLNTPGAKLGPMAAVHAMTDVTGFALLGHAAEIARASGVDLHIKLAQVPFLEGAPELAEQGYITGASGRNWHAIGERVELAEGMTDVDRALLTDPQTSGGLLLAVSPEAVDEVLALLKAEGFNLASVIGEVGAASAEPKVKVA